MLYTHQQGHNKMNNTTKQALQTLSDCTKAVQWVSPACAASKLHVLSDDDQSKYNTIADCMIAQLSSIPRSTKVSVMSFQQDAEAFPTLILSNVSVDEAIARELNAESIKAAQDDCDAILFPILAQDEALFC